MVPAPLGPWGWGKNYPKFTNFQKSSSLQPNLWRKNLMHGDVEQEGLYQNCEIYNLWGGGFAPRGWGQCLLTFGHFINFFLITTALILFKFDMMHLRDKGGINYEFQVSCPPGAFGVEQKVSKLTNF
jgi:hypothetical protein